MKIRLLALFLLLVMTVLLLAACGDQPAETTPGGDVTTAAGTTTAPTPGGDGPIRTEPTPPVTSAPVNEPVVDPWSDPMK